jgi:SAM-dependent methyltransferase
MTTDPGTTYDWYESNAKNYFAITIDINMTMLYVPFLSYMRAYAAILDAGCGSGRDTLYFARRGYKVTAFDYSPSMVQMAAKLTGQEVIQLSFQEVQFENTFDGIWACSSLLHVPVNEMPDAVSRLSRAMKVDGVLYASFRYGTGEHNRDGRICVDLDEEGADDLIGQHPELTAIRHWKTSDLREGREKEKWLNLLVRKSKPTKKMTFLGVGQSPKDRDHQLGKQTDID